VTESREPGGELRRRRDQAHGRGLCGARPRGQREGL